MDEEDIQDLFRQAARGATRGAEDVQRIFTLLIGTTLRYRDHVMETSGQVVTVEHVRTALKCLVPTLATGEIPETENEISSALLRLWLKELASLGYPRIYFE